MKSKHRRGSKALGSTTRSLLVTKSKVSMLNKRRHQKKTKELKRTGKSTLKGTGPPESGKNGGQKSGGKQLKRGTEREGQETKRFKGASFKRDDNDPIRKELKGRGAKKCQIIPSTGGLPGKFKTT